MKLNWGDYFIYDETSPSCLRWKVNRAQMRAGNEAGSITGSNGYWQVRLTINGNRQLYLCHRIIIELHDNEITEGLQVDHINGNPVNNRISNLRIVTQSVNLRNKKRYSDNSSGITGVKLTQSGKYEYFSACWYDNAGKEFRKHFSITKLGYETAKRSAIEYRTTMIAELGDYTARHGT